MVGLAGAFGQILDLIVLDCDLAAQEFVLAFDALDVAGVSRGLSRPVWAGRLLLSRLFIVIQTGDIGRDRSRPDATGRTSSM